jgi:LL-diaminopimelate aminotransferase
VTHINSDYSKLTESYLFYETKLRAERFEAAHPERRLLRLGIGDVTLPLAPVVIEALHKAVDEQARQESFHGYMPELGMGFMKQAAAANYARRGVTVDPEEVFVCYGIGDDLGAIGGLFARENRVAVVEPAYPAYADTNIMSGRTIVPIPGTEENGFLPLPSPELEAELVYLCSPNNPTGAAYSKAQLQRWVDWANEQQAVIIFDAAYEAFITDPDVPHSIYELPGARECAIEMFSLSKSAGFTGTRLGYTVVPKALIREGRSLQQMWVRNRSTCTNGVSYLLQRAGEAALTEEGLRQSRANLGVYQKNAELLTAALDRCGVRYFGGQNAPYLWLRCPEGMDSWAFFDDLMERAGVVGTPGVGFGACGEGWFRFSCFSTPAVTAEAAERLIAYFA